MLKKVAILSVVLAVCSVASADLPQNSIFQTQSYSVGDNNVNCMTAVVSTGSDNTYIQSYQGVSISSPGSIFPHHIALYDNNQGESYVSVTTGFNSTNLLHFGIFMPSLLSIHLFP